MVSAMNVTVQLLESAVAGPRMHGSGVMLALDPAGWLVNVKLTVPAGGVFAPLAVSVTVTVQVTGEFAGVEAGQLSSVEVERACGLGLSTMSCATQSAPCDAFAVLFPVGPGIACTTSADSDVVLVSGIPVLDPTS